MTDSPSYFRNLTNLSQFLPGTLRELGPISLIHVLGFGFALLQQFFLARTLGTADFGKLTFGLSVIGLLAIFSGLGLPLASLRFIPEYISNHKYSTIASFSQFANGVSLVGSLLVGGLSILFLSFNYLSVEKAATLTLFLILLIPITLVNLKQEVLRAFNRTQESILLSLVVRPVLILAAAFYLSTINQIELPLLVVVILGANLLTLILFQGRESAELSKLKTQSPELSQPAKEKPIWIKVAIALSGVLIVSFALSQVDIIVVGFFLTPATTGEFAIAIKFATVIAIPLIIMNSVFAPRYSALFFSKDLEQLQKLLTRISLLCFLFSLGLAVPFVIWGKSFLAILGSAFEGAYLPMVILVIGEVINLSLGPVGYLADLTGLHLDSFYIRSGILVVAVFFYFMLVPTMGIIGAALVTCLTKAAWNLALYHLVKSKHGLTSSFLFRAS